MGAIVSQESELNGKVEAKPLRLDLGCGPNPREGFQGVDAIAFNDRVLQFDIRQPWPWADQSVDEIHCSHFVEHLTAQERIHFFNELFRVLKPNVRENGLHKTGFATIIVPHWSSCRAYGDPTHQWPPMGEFFWYYLCADWRAGNAPHCDSKHNPQGYSCHLECNWGYNLAQDVASRNQEFQQFAISKYKEAVMDMVCTACRKETRNG